MEHLKKYWYWYALGVAAIIGTLIYFNWDTVKGWFSSEDRSGKRGISNRVIMAPIRDNNGKLTGRFYPALPSVETKKIPCKKITYVVNGVTYTGWVGDCDFPIV